MGRMNRVWGRLTRSLMPFALALALASSTRAALVDCEWLLSRSTHSYPERMAAFAEKAGLHYLGDSGPGITRKLAGEDFQYFMPSSEEVASPAIIERIRALAIPPAYQNVWISLDPRSHIQMTGLDSKKRKQYRYHERWNEVRSQFKFMRVAEFGEATPLLQEAVARDLKTKAVTKKRVVAALIRLLEKTAIRVGNEEYAEQNGSYGLTTMQKQHLAQIEGSRFVFDFVGKSSKHHTIEVQDAEVSKLLKELRGVDGDALFQYQGSDGVWHSISSADVNAYLKEVAGDEFTAKDYRTWIANQAAVAEFLRLPAPTSTEDGEKLVKQAMKAVSERLGNTPAVARKSYVSQQVIDAYLDGHALGDAHQKAAEWHSNSISKEGLTVIFLLKQSSLRLRH